MVFTARSFLTHPQACRDVPLARARAFHPLYVSLGEWPRPPFTARIERAQFHRARSASKEGARPLPSAPSITPLSEHALTFGPLFL